MTDNIQLLKGDCLELMQTIPSQSINMILCDLPYGRTHNRWDSIIPYDKLREQYERVIKPNGCIALFCDGLFMAELMLSNKKLWKYNLVWDKVLPSGFLNANKQPLRSHEEIAIFYKSQPTYNPQKIKGKPNHSKGAPKECSNNNYGNFDFVDNREELGDMKHPKSIITVQKPHPSTMLHPTQKPVEVLEWLIKTYTNEGDTVLDNCMGSGSTGIACVNTHRNFIGIELTDEYFAVAKGRIEKHQKEASFNKEDLF
jgi:site-specific DNA-methyltransferase (adenine-specific)